MLGSFQADQWSDQSGADGGGGGGAGGGGSSVLSTHVMATGCTPMLCCMFCYCCTHVLAMHINIPT